MLFHGTCIEFSLGTHFLVALKKYVRPKKHLSVILYLVHM